MKQSITFYDFERAFSDMGRQDQFTYEGKRALFEWFEDYDSDLASCGQPETELYVIALCCEFTEYENLAEFQDNYGAEDYPDIESIQEYTTVIFADHYTPTKCDHEFSFIIADF